MKNRFLIYIFLVFSVFACKIQKPEFLNCTQQDWIVNNKNQSGSVYHIIIKSNTDSAKLKIDSICIKNKIVKDFKYSVLGKSNTSKNFIENDSILISFNFLNNYNYYNFYSNDKIFIRLKNKRKTVKINTVQKLSTIIND